MGNSMIFWDPLIPDLFLWPLLAICAGLAIACLLKFKKRGIFRSLTLLILAVVMLNPMIEKEKRTPLQNKALIIIDQSFSQRETGRADFALRQADALSAQLRSLTPKPEISRHIYNNERSQSRQNTESDHGTRLMAFAQSILAQEDSERVSALFLVTDGLIADLPKDPIPGFTFPVHVITPDLGAQEDLALTILDAPQFGAVGSDAIIKYRIDKWLGNALSLPHQDEANIAIAMDGETLFEANVTIGQDHEFTLPIDRRGMHYLDIRINGDQNDYSRLNNRRILGINGIRDRLKVLLISGLPYPGERVWRNLLKSDPAIDLVHFTILRPADKRDATPVNELALISFPTRSLFEEKLNEFDLVIFDRYRRQGLLPDIYLRYLTDYVEQGGAVLVSAGPSFTGPFGLSASPLNRILPARPAPTIFTEPFLPNVTDIGARHPVTRDMAALQQRNQTPWGRWFMQVEVVPTNTADVLMTGQDNSPLLMLDHATDGRVAILASDQIW